MLQTIYRSVSPCSVEEVLAGVTIKKKQGIL